MKTIAVLFAAVMIFAGCSARQEEMMSEVESSVSSVIEPDRSSSDHVTESNPGASSSESVIGSDSESVIESDTSRMVR